MRLVAGVDLFPSRSLIPCNLLILRWSGMPRKATKAIPSFRFSLFLFRGSSCRLVQDETIFVEALLASEFRGTRVGNVDWVNAKDAIVALTTKKNGEWSFCRCLLQASGNHFWSAKIRTDCTSMSWPSGWSGMPA